MRITRKGSGPVTIALTVLAAALAWGPGRALATPVPLAGVLNLGNFSVDLTPGCIAFYNGPGLPTCPPVGSATVMVDAPVGAGFTFNTTGTLMDLTSAGTGFVQADSLVMASGGPAGYGPISFDTIADVPPSGTPCPAGGPAVGSSCAIPGSPFEFFNFSSGASIVSLTLEVCAYTGTPGSPTITGTTGSNGVPTNCSAGTLYQDVISAQFVLTYSQILAEYLGGGVQDSASATLGPVTPEPISFVLFGSGLIGMALLGRRVRRS